MPWQLTNRCTGRHPAGDARELYKLTTKPDATMNNLTLIIGNKNYSSWSLRPWLLLKHFDIPFEEVRIPLYSAESQDALRTLSPSGLVPTLIHGDLKIWDSLAICEYIQELFPSLAMWPFDREARGVARSVSCEMHSGFSAIRNHMPMNCKKSFPGKGLNTESESEIARVQKIWRECRTKYEKKGQCYLVALRLRM